MRARGEALRPPPHPLPPLKAHPLHTLPSLTPTVIRWGFYEHWGFHEHPGPTISSRRSPPNLKPINLHPPSPILISICTARNLAFIEADGDGKPKRLDKGAALQEWAERSTAERWLHEGIRLQKKATRFGRRPQKDGFVRGYKHGAKCTPRRPHLKMGGGAAPPPPNPLPLFHKAHPPACAAARRETHGLSLLTLPAGSTLRVVTESKSTGFACIAPLSPNPGAFF